MHNQYIVNKKQASVSDEKGNLETREYSTNFEKILEKENEIELLENQLEYVKTEIDNFIKLRKKEEERFKTIFGFALVVLTFILMALFCLESVSLWILLKIFLTIGIDAMLILPLPKISHFLFSKTYKKEIESNKFQAHFLEKDLEKTKQELYGLKEKNIPMKSPKKPKVMRVPGKEKLQELKSYFECLKYYGFQIQEQADTFVNGFWESQEKERIAESGIDPQEFANYLNKYNTRELTRRKKAV